MQRNCNCRTKKGTPCKNSPIVGKPYCYQHTKFGCKNPIIIKEKKSIKKKSSQQTKIEKKSPLETKKTAKFQDKAELIEKENYESEIIIFWVRIIKQYIDLSFLYQSSFNFTLISYFESNKEKYWLSSNIYKKW